MNKTSNNMHVRHMHVRHIATCMYNGLTVACQGRVARILYILTDIQGPDLKKMHRHQHLVVQSRQDIYSCVCVCVCV